MTTEKDFEANGWTNNSNGTWSNANSDDKRLLVTGDTGQVYIKDMGRADNGYRPYDSDRDK
jgi:hypothetical protein